MKLPTIEIAVHIGVGEEDFGRATFDDYIEDVRAFEFIEGLRRKDHGGVMFAPRFEGFDDVSLDVGVLQKYPGFIDEERFENRANLAVGGDGIRAMEGVEAQRFQKVRGRAHALEGETL